MIHILAQYWILFIIGIPLILLLAIIGIICCLITLNNRNKEMKQLEDKLNPPETSKNITIVLPLDNYYDSDITAFLKHVENKHEYLKRLIRKDIHLRYQNQKLKQ